MRERLLHPSKKQAANANPTAGTSAYLLSEYLQPKLLAQIQALKAENKVLQERKEKAENAAIRWYVIWSYFVFGARIVANIPSSRWSG